MEPEISKPIIHATLQQAGYSALTPNLGTVAVNLFGKRDEQQGNINTSSFKPGPPYVESDDGTWVQTGSGDKLIQTKPEMERDDSTPNTIQRGKDKTK